MSSNRKRETAAERRKRASKVTGLLKRLYPGARTALEHSNPLELLLSTILSAQCTDERVNKVTPVLFNRYRNATEYANAGPEELEEIIRSTGFYHAKAKSIINCCRELIASYGGEVPGTMADLVRLPGVGRKTANVILGNFFGKAEGIVVDTHVKRLAGRLGFSEEETPEKIEVDLMDMIPQKDWIPIGNLLILHGRAICQARKPKCPECVLNKICPYGGEFLRTGRA